ncbi:prohibitin family protein [Sorangium sp. So ce1151]|uniref:prohibitin family protein n=1 Tax=Sorangium sp. So ce1151 TaxID=3133332 RepID=UPI003F625D2B
MPNDEPLDDIEDKPTLRERITAWLLGVQTLVYMLVVLALLVLGFVWPRVFINVPAGHRGVLYRYFAGGTVVDPQKIFGEGLHIIVPWNSVTNYEVRLQQKRLKFDVLSDEGLDLGVEVVVRYHPRQDMLGYLQRDIGPEYFDRLIRPDAEAHVRRTFGSRPAHEIYSSARDLLQELGNIPALGRVQKTDTGEQAFPYIVIEELKLVDIELPRMVQDAIKERFRQEQLLLEYRYRLEREEQEAERKRTEAAGIRDYNLIAGNVSPDLLRWRGIDATLELASSQNAKVVVLGGGQGGIPLMLNFVDSPIGTSAAAPPAGGAPAPAGGAAPARARDGALPAAPAPASANENAAPAANNTPPAAAPAPASP